MNDAIEEAVKEDVERMGLETEEADAIKELRTEKAQTVCSKWFRYGEYLAVEIDTEACTCTVIPADR